MPTTYKVVTGDTFEKISRKQYGTEVEADRIARANPGVVEPLSWGIEIAIPVVPGAPQNLPPQTVTRTENEVALILDGKRFRFWDNIQIKRAVDVVDSVEFSAPFDSSVSDFKNAFRPFSYKRVEVTLGGDPLFTGTMVAVNPVLTDSKKTVAVSGYSLPGVLNDCTPPASLPSLEFLDQKLPEIAAAIAAPFGIGVVFEADPGAVFEQVAVNTGEKALTFLTKLAKQRNLVISSTSKGELLFLQSTEGGKPVATLQQGEPPLLEVTPFFSPQEYYSHITGIEPVFIGLAGTQYTVKNPRLNGVIRPMMFNISDSVDAEVKETVEAKAGRMFGNMAAYSARVATWRDPSGKLWEPNTTVTLFAPDAMVYTAYEFVIRSIVFERAASSEMAVLDLVIPGSFSGKIPEVLPWDG